MDIAVYDPPGGTGKKCGCKKEAMFVLLIGDQYHHLCESCIAEVAKRIIDGLV